MAIDLSGQDPLFQGIGGGLEQLSKWKLQDLAQQRQAQIGDWREQQKLGRRAAGIQAIAPNELSDKQAQGLAALPERALQEYMRQIKSQKDREIYDRVLAEEQGVDGQQDATGVQALPGDELQMTPEQQQQQQAAAQQLQQAQSPEGQLGAMQQQLQPQMQGMLSPEQSGLPQRQPQQSPEISQFQGMQQPQAQQPQEQQTDQPREEESYAEKQAKKLAGNREIPGRNISQEEYEQMDPQMRAAWELKHSPDPYEGVEKVEPKGEPPVSSYETTGEYLKNDDEYWNLLNKARRATSRANKLAGTTFEQGALNEAKEARKELSDYRNQIQRDLKEEKKRQQSIRREGPLQRMIERVDDKRQDYSQLMFHIKQGRTSDVLDRHGLGGYFISSLRDGGFINNLTKTATKIGSAVAGFATGEPLSAYVINKVGRQAADSAGDLLNSMAKMLNRLNPEEARLSDNLKAIRNNLNKSYDVMKSRLSEREFNTLMGQMTTLFSSEEQLRSFFNMSQGMGKLAYADVIAHDRMLQENYGEYPKNYQQKMNEYTRRVEDEVLDSMQRQAEIDLKAVTRAQNISPFGEAFKSGKVLSRANKAAKNRYESGQTAARNRVGMNLFN